MTQERADLNWYHSPTDYYSVRDRKPPSQESSGNRQAHSAQLAMAGPTHETEPGEFTFDDFLDIINPLHHLPVVSSLYREATGDQISAHARIIGGGLYGGGTGFVASIANAISEEASGRDIGENLVAAVFGEDESGSDVLVAQTKPPTTTKTAIEAPVANSRVSALTGTSEAEPTATNSPAREADAPGATTQPPLTGAAALSALFSDVKGTASRDADRQTPPAVRPGQAARAAGPGGLGLDPAVLAAFGGAAGPARETLEAPGQSAPGQSAPGQSANGFTDRMLLGLKKYEEMVRQDPTGSAERARL